MTRKMIIGMHLGNAHGSQPGSWRMPGVDPTSYAIFDAKVRHAQAAERGKLQFLFLPDGPSTVGDIAHEPACQYIAVQLIEMAAANPVSTTGRRLSELRGGVGGMFLDHRPRPVRPRTVKISKNRYPVDRKAAPLK